jgi:small subunit ribosomal protein S17
MTQEAAATADAKSKPRRVGMVTSDKMDKTITVVVERLVRHPLYRKYVRRRTVLKAHDENQEAKTGDRVEVEFSRPLSKTKRWQLVRVVQKGAGA